MYSRIKQVNKLTLWSSVCAEKRRLLPTQIDIWYTHLKQDWLPALLHEYRALCSEEEKVQQNRFLKKEDQQNYLVSRGLLRWVLAQYLEDISSKDIIFRKGRFGKPFIDNLGNVPIQFSLSHTKNLAVLAVVLEEDIGIDIESTEREMDDLSIALNFFSPNEYKHLCNLPSDQFKAEFVKIWTLKEAYLKACGTGLTTPLNQFYFSFANGEIKISFNQSFKDDSSNWQFYHQNLAHKHHMSLAIKNKHQKSYQISVKESIPLRCFRELTSSFVKFQSTTKN